MDLGQETVAAALGACRSLSAPALGVLLSHVGDGPAAARLWAHPAADLSHPQLQSLAWVDLGRTLRRTSEAMAARLVRALPVDTCRMYVQLTAEPHPAAVQLVLEHALAGDAAAAWAVLTHVDGPAHAAALEACSSYAAGSFDLALTWLAEAARHRDRLTGWVQRVPGAARPAVAWLAQVAATGADPLSALADAVRTVPSGVVPGWLPAPPAASRDQPELLWMALVDACGHEGLAAAALQACPTSVVIDAVRTHPRLAGTAVGQVAQLACDGAGQPFDVPAAGPLEPSVFDLARVKVFAEASDVRTWVRGGHTSAAQLLAALARLLELSDTASEALPAAVCIAELACLPAATGPVWDEALAGAGELLADPADVITSVRALLTEQLRAWMAVARAVRTGAGVGSVRVADAGVALWRTGQSVWFEQLLGDYFATVPGVDDPAMVAVLVDLAAAQSTGTFGDLVAAAAGVLA